MKSISVMEGLLVAALGSLASAAGFGVLATLFGGRLVLPWVIALAAFGYVLYLLLRSRERSGRVAVTALWLLAAALNLVLAPSLAIYIVVHLGLIWLVRVLYHYHGVLPALLDLALMAAALAVALYSWLQSHSLFLSLWSFFLIQSLFVLIPKQLHGRGREARHGAAQGEAFERAHKAAELALRKLTNIH